MRVLNLYLICRRMPQVWKQKNLPHSFPSDGSNPYTTDVPSVYMKMEMASVRNFGINRTLRFSFSLSLFWMTTDFSSPASFSKYIEPLRSPMDSIDADLVSCVLDGIARWLLLFSCFRFLSILDWERNVNFSASFLTGLLNDALLVRKSPTSFN